MPLSPEIALGFKPIQIESPLNRLASIMQLQHGENQNRLAEYSLSKAQRADEESNALLRLVQQPNSDLTSPDFQNQAYKVAPNAAATFFKGQLENKKLSADIQKTSMESLVKATDLHRSALSGVNTPEDAARWVAAGYSDPVLGKHLNSFSTLDDAVSRIPRDAESLERWKQQNALGAAEFIKQNAPKLEKVDTNGRVQLLSVPGLGGTPSTIGSYEKEQSPDAILSAKTSTANNQRTVGASLANAAATREVASATRAAANAQRDQSTEMKLADDYRAQSKDFGQATSAYKQINATLDSATKSPAATLAAATKFMKILDPGSVVRESELGMALAASGVIDRAQNYMNVLNSGKVLTPTQVADFRDITRKMYIAAQQVQKSIDADYKSKADRYNLRSDMIVQDLGQNERFDQGKSEQGVPEDIANLVKLYGGKR